MKTLKTGRLWISIGALLLLAPLGLLLPELLRAGDAWGEWDAEALKDMVGFIPEGLAGLGSLWPAPIPDYGFSGVEGRAGVLAGYIGSGVIGVVLVAGVSLVLGRIIARRNKDS